PFSGILGTERQWPANPDGLPLRDIHLQQDMKLRAERFAPVYTEAVHVDKTEILPKEHVKPVTWHPVFLAQAVLAQFCRVASDWLKTLEKPADEVLKSILSVRLIEEEVKVLVYLSMAERPRRLPEIVRQADDIRPYFNSLLGGSMVGKPASSALIETGLAVGLM